LAAGHWEFNARVGANQYVERVEGTRPRRNPRTEQPPTWFDVLIEPVGLQRVVISISDQAAQIDGRVSVQGSGQGKPAPGVPVFLWPETEAARRSLGGVRIMTADVEGHFLFQGIPPGTYRILATFDALEIDEDVLAESQAQSITVGKSARANVELALWVAP
jgi:hypothetical protein